MTGWKNNEDLIDCMCASGWLPLFAQSLTKKYRGSHCFDGGIEY